jgi:DNA (cytosine-5)-methyltransferase 1
MTFGSLFAGIGGFDLGFERAGLQCKWQVEINEFCRRVLAKHWPDVRRHDDVKTFPPEGSDLDEWRADVICGGFPCQDISKAARFVNRQVGIAGERSGLWSEYARIVRVLRPRFVVVENSTALLAGDIGRVLGDLAEIGFHAEWHCLPSAAVGAPHIRDRVFILAHTDGKRIRGQRYSQIARKTGEVQRETRQWTRLWTHTQPVGEACRVADDGHNGGWDCEPRVDRVVCRIPNAVERNRGYGNAVCPVVAEWIGRRLIEHTAN